MTETTRVQCVECGTEHSVIYHPELDPFAAPCISCSACDSIPIGFEASLLEELEDWTDEEAQILF